MKFFSGRINYPTYITGKFFFAGLFYIPLVIIGFMYDFDRTTFLFIGVIILIPFSYIDSSLDIRRAHDIGKSGAWTVFGMKNVLVSIQNTKAQIAYAIKTRQWENIFNPTALDQLTKQYGHDFPRWDWMYLDSENQPNQYGEKPKNGIDILGLFGL